ncbi:MAG: HlyD family secretion protein [Victivallaceae bacterium]|nr:biotin/lipoyl-binding protein [Victivallaceae bacterium]
MFVKYVIPPLAALALGFGLATAIRLTPDRSNPGVSAPSAQSVMTVDKIYGLGLIESAGGNVTISSPLSGTIEKVSVRAGDTVRHGDPLFTVDGAELRAEMTIMEKEMKLKSAQLKQLRAGTHPDEIKAAECRAASAEAGLMETRDEWARAQKLLQANAISFSDHQRKRFAFLAAKAAFENAEAAVRRLRNWPRNEDIMVARRELELATARWERAKIDYDRSRITAPEDCKVLQVNIRKGEYINLAVNSRPHIVLAPEAPLQLRVQVDEELAAAVNANAEVTATIRDRRNTKLELRYVRTEPIVIPKTSFSGRVTEKQDTRVINIIYEITGSDGPVFIGQQSDVYFQPASTTEK